MIKVFEFKMEKKYFTLYEARKILPDVKKLLEKLLKSQMKLFMQEKVYVEYDDDFLEASKSVKNRLRFHKNYYDFFKVFDELIEMGVFVKDPSIGLVDFYSKFDGKEIFLCYRYPEKTINFWHDIEGGYDIRQSVGLLEKKHNIK